MVRAIRTAGALAIAAALTTATPSAFADASPEAHLLQLVNAARVAAGLGPLTTDAGLATVARGQTTRMADAATLFHNTNLAKDVGGGWTLLGENVGYGPDADRLHEAFMASPHHRDNVLGSFDRVGIAFAESHGDGMLYVTEVFMRSAASRQAGAQTSRPAVELGAASRPPAAVRQRASAAPPAPASRPAATDAQAQATAPSPSPAAPPARAGRGPLIWRS